MAVAGDMDTGETGCKEKAKTMEVRLSVDHGKLQNGAIANASIQKDFFYFISLFLLIFRTLKNFKHGFGMN